MYAHYPAIEQYRQDIAAFYAQVPTREYWPPQVLDHTLSQIRHCARAQFFADADTPRTLLAELRAMLHDNMEAAYRGHKSIQEGGDTGAEFDLFFNDFAYTNNVILIFSDARPVSVFTTFDNPNFIKSTGQEIFEKAARWIERIEQSSVRISHAGEQQRHRMFKQMQVKIEAMEQELATF